MVGRRRAAAAVVAIEGGGGQGPQGPKEKVGDKFSWEAHLKRIHTEEAFKLRYRLTYDGFMALHSHLRPDLKVKDPKQAQRNKGYVVDTRQPCETRRLPSLPCREAILDLVRTARTPILILLRL